MSGPDRGTELVTSMLERRAATPPAGLRERILADAARTPQAADGRRLDRLRMPLVIVGLMALVAAGGYVAGHQGMSAASLAPSGGAPSQPGGAGSPDSSGQTPGATGGGMGSPSQPTPTATEALPPTAPPSLTVGALAVVTPEGDGLRVRTEAGLGGNSKRLEPLLASGTRMLILRGPLTVDNHDWYEVSIDGTPSFGWVASAGDGVDWLAPVAPSCSGSRVAAEAWTLPVIDLVACYGAQPFSVQAVGFSGPADGICTYVAKGRACLPEPRWLLEPKTVIFRGDAGDLAPLDVAVPDSVVDLIAGSSSDAPVGLMIALDHPAAQACRVVDNAGLDVIARDAVVATCRQTFTVVAVTR